MNARSRKAAFILFSLPMPNKFKEYFSRNSFRKTSNNSLLEGGVFAVFIFIAGIKSITG